MQIHVYAALKEYFDSEFELSDPVQNTEELKASLLAINGKAAAILQTCRFAVEEGFIDKEFKLKAHDTIVIIPPSSGG